MENDAIYWFFLIGGVILLSCFVVAIGFSLFRKRMNLERVREDQEIASYVLNAIALIYCVLLGFIVINVEERHGEVYRNVEKEAAILSNLYASCAEFPGIDCKPIQTEIENYVVHIINEEWPKMKEGVTLALDPISRPHSLWKVFAGIDPKSFRELTIYQQLLDKFNQLSEARFIRVTSIRPNQSLFMWGVLIYGAILLIALSFLFASKSIFQHLLQILFFTSFIVLILFLIFYLDSPYSGPTAITAQPFQDVLEQIKLLKVN